MCLPALWNAGAEASNGVPVGNNLPVTTLPTWGNATPDNALIIYYQDDSLESVTGPTHKGQSIGSGTLYRSRLPQPDDRDRRCDAGRFIRAI